MPWFHAKNKETGEAEFVLVPVGGGNSYRPETHELTALPRKPDQYDDFVDGKLVKNAERKGKHARAERWAAMDVDELLARLEALEAAVELLT